MRRRSERNRLRAVVAWMPCIAVTLPLWIGGCSDGSDVEVGMPIQQGTTLDLDDGRVAGAIDGGTRRFLGIPFAAPPVGALRWRPPAPVTPWSGVLEATEFGSSCPQRSSTLGTPSENEDCLYLNVWTPDPAPAHPLPVMVWFHGGANVYGSAGDPIPLGLTGLIYNGRPLVENRDVVVVTANYRLGVFGFLAHAQLATEDADHPYAGNQGLLDQRAVLEWVHRNIGAFGGDAGNVTIFGESAGSVDVCLHLVSPGSRGLFHRAISESGGCTTRQRTTAEGAEIGNQLAEAVDCDHVGDMLACLRKVPVGTLLDAGVTPGITVDGDFLPDQPRALFAAGRTAKVPYIAGSNADEGTIFFLGVPPVTSEEEYLAALRERFGDRAEAVARVYPISSYPNPQDALMRAFGDNALVCPTYDSARRAAASGAHVYLYNFARWVQIPAVQALDLRALHGVEMQYVFASVEPPSEVDRVLTEDIQGYWTRFAEDGDPNGDGAVTWPRYEDSSDLRMNLDADISVVPGFRRAECEFWWSVYDEAFE